MYDIIEKKRNGKSLTKDEISFVIDGMIKKLVPPTANEAENVEWVII